MKRHSAEGARIVGKFGRLRECVPIIRHHHERWDGGGYPDGLAGAEIPLEAAIVGLADAWDAMTTDPPLPPGAESGRGDGGGQEGPGSAVLARGRGCVLRDRRAPAR